MERRCRSFILLSITLLIFSGCISAPKQFPIGLYAVGEAEDLPELASAGFNHVLGKADRGYLDAAEANGISIFAEPNTRLPDFNAKEAERAVKELDTHPALRGWYIVDEPDLWNISPKRVQQTHRKLKRYGARKPTVVVLGTGSAAADFAHLGDISMLDRYPVNTRPLAAFGQHFRDVWLARGKERPLYAIIQAFNWRFYTNMVSGDAEKLRPPNERELRCMTYMALVHGVEGLFYYCWNDGKWIMRDHPETWEAVQNVVAEVHERAPLFQGKHLWWPHSVKYLAGPKLNDVGEAALALAYVEVAKGNFSTGPGRYLVAVNTTPAQISAQVQIPDNPASTVRILGVEEAQTLDGGAYITEEFAPYAVRIFGPITGNP